MRVRLHLRLVALSAWRGLGRLYNSDGSPNTSRPAAFQVSNSAVGYGSLFVNTGQGNTAVGFTALVRNASGSNKSTGIVQRDIHRFNIDGE